MNKIDLELAMTYAKQIEDNFQFKSVSNGKVQTLWYCDIKSGLWREDGVGFLMALFNHYNLPKDLGFYKKVEFIISTNTIISDTKFRTPNNCIALSDLKMLDLKDLKVVELNTNCFFQKKVDVSYNHKARSPRVFLNALEKAMPDPQKMFLLLQGLSTLFLVRTQDVDDIFILQGSGQNGKTTILSTITYLFREFVSAISMHALQENRFMLGQVEGKLANIYSDISGMRLKDINILKMLSSGDLATIDNKFQRPHDAIIKVVQMYSCNKMPEIEDKSFAIGRRFIPIEFTEKILITDRNIREKLREPEEQTRIFTMLLRIARYTKKYGYLYRPNEKEVLDILEERGNPIIQFLSDKSGYIKEDILSKAEKDVVYMLYTKFCKQNGFVVQEKNSFTKVLHKRGFTETRTDNTKYWKGLKINEDMMPKIGQEKL